MNWTKLVTEILEADGYGLSRLARETGVTHEAMRKLLNGNIKTPKHRLGDRLITLHFHLRKDLYIIGNQFKQGCEEGSDGQVHTGR